MNLATEFEPQPPANQESISSLFIRNAAIELAEKVPVGEKNPQTNQTDTQGITAGQK
jgi:hypothetical protein